MDNIDSVLYNLETEIDKISADIKVDFGNEQLMRKQLKSINNYQSKLEEIKIKINEIIRATEVEKNDFSIIAGIAGGLLALFGGTVSGLGLDLAGEAANNYNHKEDKIKSIRQKCVSLQKKIEPTIFYIENIKDVAHKSFTDSRLMKFLYKKIVVKNMITAFLTGINYLLLIVTLIILIASLVLFFRAEFMNSFLVLLGGFFMFVIIGLFYNFVENTNKKWELLIKKIAGNIR
ncbi:MULTISPECIES: hypothetical protein [unclassified Nostoc]|nr:MULTISPECIES: hypothetical protein [unclassified Nostoc]